MKKFLTLILLATIHFTFAQQTDAIVKKASEVETKWGYKAKNKNIITLIDFSKSIDSARLYVVDIKNNKILAAIFSDEKFFTVRKIIIKKYI